VLCCTNSAGTHHVKLLVIVKRSGLSMRLLGAVRCILSTIF
jgi:hypothetical protein